MKQRYTFLTLFLFSIIHLSAQSVRKDYLLQADMDTKCTAVFRSYDDGFFAVGISGKSKGSTFDKAVVWKYNSSRELIWEKSIAVPLNQGQGIYHADALPLQDGSLIVSINLFECDVFTYDYLIRVSANGAVLWTKETTGVFQKLIAGYANSFYLYNGDGATQYDVNGNILADIFTIPKIRQVITGDRVLNCDGAKVWLEDATGNPLGLPWYSPETVSSLDTTANGGVAVFTQDKIYKLNASLQLIGEQLFTGVGDLDIHTFQAGFIYTRDYIDTKQLVQLDANAQVLHVLGLEKTIEDVRVVVKDSLFFLGATISAPDQGFSGWIASDHLVKSEIWKTGTDANISEMFYAGNLNAHVINSNPWTFYDAYYGDVSLRVQNLGIDTIHSFQVNFRIESCDMFCFVDGGLVKRFDGVSIPPGEGLTLPFGEINTGCTRQDVRNFCMWISDINHHRDDVIENNVKCADFSFLLVGTQNVEVEKIEILPNPAGDYISIKNENNASITDYAIMDLSGRVVQTGDLLQPSIPVASIPNGWYVLRLTVDKEYAAFQKVIIQH